VKTPKKENTRTDTSSVGGDVIVRASRLLAFRESTRGESVREERERREKGETFPNPSLANPNGSSSSLPFWLFPSLLPSRMYSIGHTEDVSLDGWALGSVLGKGLSAEVKVAVRNSDGLKVFFSLFSSLHLSFLLSFPRFCLCPSFSHFFPSLVPLIFLSLSIQFAMKIVDFPALVSVFRDYDITAETLEANLMREIEVMRRLRHRNIIHLEDSFWKNDYLFICMELVEGKNLLRTVPPGGMPENTAKDFFFQLCSAVSFCHANNVHTSSPLLLHVF
jgi:hypothetical protein